jgi:serine/threonine protein kinase
MSHGDLKPSNILIDKNNNVKIIDFGSVTFYHSKYLKNPYQRCTIFYASPEELIYEKYSIYNDWWSLGVIMYEFCTRKCFISTLFDYLKVNKTKMDLFLEYAYTRNTDLFDNAKDFIVTFYSTVKTSNINKGEKTDNLQQFAGNGMGQKRKIVDCLVDARQEIHQYRMVNANDTAMTSGMRNS